MTTEERNKMQATASRLNDMMNRLYTTFDDLDNVWADKMIRAPWDKETDEWKAITDEVGDIADAIGKTIDKIDDYVNYNSDRKCAYK